jgi:protein ImuA
MDSSQQALLRRLEQCIREIEANARPCAETAISPCAAGLETVLPEESLRGGSLVELLSARPGASVWTLALILARQACGERKALVVADEERRFYPPAAARMGIDLCRTVVIRPKSRHFLSAIVQSLRCPAVGAVLGWFDRLPPVDFRRLQLAAEAGGGLGLLLRPRTALRTPSFAAARLLVAPVAAGVGHAASVPDRTPIACTQPARTLAACVTRRRLRVEAVRVCGGKSGRAVVLEVDDETGDVHVPAVLAPAMPVASAARSSG